jgi:hypothetical protein
MSSLALVREDRPRDFWVTVTDPERAATFERVFGTRTVPILSPIPHLAGLPGFAEKQPVYELDLEWLTADARERLIDHLAERFGGDRADVAAEIDRVGVPILEERCVVRIDHAQRWF